MSVSDGPSLSKVWCRFEDLPIGSIDNARVFRGTDCIRPRYRGFPFFFLFEFLVIVAAAVVGTP